MYRRRNVNVLMIVIGALSLIIVISLVYAAFTGQLNITGTAVGRDSNWDIHFENVSSITTSGTAKVLSNHQPTINPNNRTQIQDYEVSLTSPNDSIIFTFDVVNDGNYNAKVTDIDVGTPECSSTDTTSAVNMCNNLTYTLTYAGGASVQTNDVLYAKDKLSFKVTLKFNDISNPDLLPKAGVSISNLGIQINFEQEGNALVKDDGTVANNRVYHIGDKVTVNNEDYWVIEDSGAGQDYVVALKDLPLTASEVNLYGGAGTENNHVNRYTNTSVGTANNGNVAFYSSETCGLINGVTVRTGCTDEYDQSDVKYVVDSWKAAKFINNELKTVDGYNARLITVTEFRSISSQNIWRYSSQYQYWTMTSYVGYVILININDTTFSNFSYNICKVRPVINVYKSAIDSNNNE